MSELVDYIVQSAGGLIQAVAVAILLVTTFADFLMGEARRQELKDKVETWWLHLQEVTYFGLAAEDAHKILLKLESIFGAWHRPRAFLLTVLFSALVTGAFMGAASLASIGDIWYVGSFLIILLPWNALFDWLSLGATILLLRLMVQSISISRLVLFVIVDACVAFLLAYSAFVTVIAVAASRADLSMPNGAIGLAEFFYFTANSFILHNLVPAQIIVFTSFIPSLFHLGLTLLFIASKLTQPVLQPALSFLLLRFAESPKGPLALIGISIATLIILAKMMLQWLYL